MGHGPPDGAHGDLAAARPTDASRPPELELARVRHACRLLAAAQGDAETQYQSDSHAQCTRVRDLSVGGEGLHRQRLGAQCPQLRSGADAQARRRAGGNRQVDGHHREILRQAAARLVRPRPDADLRHARLPVGSRRRIYRRLGSRRRARDNRNAPQADRGAALQFRDPRHCHDGTAEPPVRRMAWARARSLRRSLCGVGRASEIHGHRMPPVSFGRAAPHRPCRAHLRRDPVT